jgi:hypothetical protein
MSTDKQINIGEELIRRLKNFNTNIDSIMNKKEPKISIKTIDNKFIIMEGDVPYKFRDDGLVKNLFDNIEEAESMLKTILTQREIYTDIERIFGEEK